MRPPACHVLRSGGVRHSPPRALMSACWLGWRCLITAFPYITAVVSSPAKGHRKRCSSDLITSYSQSSVCVTSVYKNLKPTNKTMERHFWRCWVRSPEHRMPSTLMPTHCTPLHSEKHLNHFQLAGMEAKVNFISHLGLMKWTVCLACPSSFTCPCQ